MGTKHSKPSHLRSELIGKKFGKLTVIEFSHIDKKRESNWKCECECGCFKITSNSLLKKGDVICCGTCKKSMASTYNAVFNDYKANAKRTGRVFELTKEQFNNIIKKPCWYCKADPIFRKRKKFLPILINGIDRTDNSKGYTIQNCVPCCEKCNRMKMKLNENEFREQIEKIYNQSCGDDNKIKSIYIPEKNVGDELKLALSIVYTLCFKHNLQKSEIKVLLCNLVDEHIEETDELNPKDSK